MIMYFFHRLDKNKYQFSFIHILWLPVIIIKKHVILIHAYIQGKC